MPTTIIYYSLTKNNQKLAQQIVKNYNANIIEIKESKKRTNFTIVLDLIFNRTPKINIDEINIDHNDLIIFVAPIWMGLPAFPLRHVFKKYKNKINNYVFISLSGGADGPESNKDITNKLAKRLGKKPISFIEFRKAELITDIEKPTRDDTMAYMLDENTANKLALKAIEKLKKINV